MLAELCRKNFLVSNGFRKSKDREINSKDSAYLELHNYFNLVVLNGQTNGDDEGNFTFINTVRESVIDLCSVSVNVLQMTQNFV